ncbi:MAG: hypothetical protein ACE5EN_00135 [Nitrospinota bacterium]
MSEYTVGDKVRIPCSIQPGAFSSERLIEIETDETIFSGFINIENLQEETESKGYVVGKIISVEPEHITIQIPASLFTSAAGRTSINSSWATSNLQAVAG